jgi:hypothetical protein
MRCAYHALFVMILLAAPTLATARLRTTTRPSTQDAEAVKAGLHTYNKHMLAGDIKGMIADQHATTENGKRFAAATAESDAAVGRLEKLVQRRWGDEPRNWVAATIGDATDDVADGADVLIVGDKATVHFKTGGSNPMLKTNGKWRIDADAQAAEVSDMDAAIESMKQRTETAKQAVTDIRSGKYSTVDQLVAALREKNSD